MDARKVPTAARLHVGRLEVEVRWSCAVLVGTYLVGGLLAAVGGGHLDAGGPDGYVVGAAVFVVLALGAALFHELGHAVAGAVVGRRTVGLVLRAGAAVRIEEAEPGSRGDSAAAESVVALGGPVASGLVGLAYLNISSSLTSAIAWAGLLALSDGVVNLLPVITNSDGHRVLHAFLDRRRVDALVPASRDAG